LNHWYHEALSSNLVGTAFQPVFVHQPIGKKHDIFVHPVLMRKVDDRLGMFFRQELEERNIQSTPASFGILDLG
jgi:hypothetical protein